MKKEKTARPKTGKTIAADRARKAGEQQHTGESERIDPPSDRNDNLEIDVSMSPTFHSFEENNVWVAEALGEKYVRASGRWELFKRSRSVEGFAQARASWVAAWPLFLKSHGDARVSSGPLDLESIFFRRLRRDPSGALQDYSVLVSAAAERGDVQFIDRVSAEKRRGSRRTHKTPLAFDILHHWLHGFLWLMPAVWGSYYLEKITERPVSQENYEKTRQRMQLVGWECAHKHPLINGYRPDTGAFSFHEGWTNLVSGTSI
ncbi:MAG: hypothetical protein ACREIF_11305 [Chthoniobacterales bacterium]